MTDTRESILQTALALFAKDGYEAVAMRAIAEKLGISKAALYKHYKSKQAIFDSIVARMKAENVVQSETFPVPANALNLNAEVNQVLILKKIKHFSLTMFRYWTEDSFAANFRKMMTLEQYRNPEMAQLLNDYLSGGMVGSAKSLMAAVIDTDQDPEVLALAYFAPIYLMMNRYDQMSNPETAIKTVEKHIDSFMASMVKK